MKRVSTTTLCLAAGLTLAGYQHALAWGYEGHQVVGAIADILLAEHPKAKAKVEALLHAPLSEAATWADCAKGFSYCGRAPTPAEKAYAGKNSDHHGFHYTDVPYQQSAYRLHAAGTKDHDVVQVTRYAIQVLQGTAPVTAKTPRLSRTEAVWLLAHLVGDLHQPLHVGAAYFDSDCEKPVDPNKAGTPPSFGIGATIAETTGGNDLLLTKSESNLHHYWDDVAVRGAAGVTDPAPVDVQAFARKLAATPPSGWETEGAATTWSAKWATEIMPLAREAITRVKIGKGTPVHGSTLKCHWHVSHEADYPVWANDRAAEQLNKAGYRLAAVMIAVFGP